MPRILTPTDVTDFRNRLCDVASNLFAEVGQAGFNMRELAKRLGVSAMTPYRYFDDKDAILSEVRARAFACFADWIEQQRGRDGLARAYARFAIEYQAQYRLMFDLAQPQTLCLPAQREAELRARAAIARYAGDAVAGRMVAEDPELSGLVLWSTLHGIASLFLSGKISDDEFESILGCAVHSFTAPVDGAGAKANGHSEASFIPNLRPQSAAAIAVR